LHWLTATNGALEDEYMVPPAAYVEYFGKAFVEFCDLLDKNELKNYYGELYVDCANGVGAFALTGIQHIVEPYLKLKLYNTETSDPKKLNEHCGAEHVHK
jgi:hypothetical protein